MTLSELVAAAGQVGSLGGVARELDGLVIRRARVLAAAQPGQQVGAGGVVGVRKARAISGTVRPPTMRSVSANRVSIASAG